VFGEQGYVGFAGCSGSDWQRSRYPQLIGTWGPFTDAIGAIAPDAQQLTAVFADHLKGYE